MVVSRFFCCCLGGCYYSEFISSHPTLLLDKTPIGDFYTTFQLHSTAICKRATVLFWTIVNINQNHNIAISSCCRSCGDVCSSPHVQLLDECRTIPYIWLHRNRTRSCSWLWWKPKVQTWPPQTHPYHRQINDPHPVFTKINLWAPSTYNETSINLLSTTSCKIIIIMMIKKKNKKK